MAITSAVQHNKKNIILSNREVRKKFDSMKGIVKIFLALGWIVALFSPFLFFSWVIYILYRYFDTIYSPLLSSEENKALYEARLSPKGTREHFTTIGYRIEDDDIDNHIAMFKSKDVNAKLSAKERKYLKNPSKKRKSGLIGFDIDLLTRHIILIGKTGSGKTVTILSVINDVLEGGGGFIVLDGKADVKMWSTIYSLIREHKRETSLSTVNLLKPETKPATNTFNEVQKMHPLKAVEFYVSLITPESMDGNTQYFLNRGKALITPIFCGLSIRKTYYDEPYSNTTLAKSSDVPEMIVSFILFYCIARAVKEDIEKNEKLNKYIREGKRLKISDLPMFASYEAILEYVGQNPSSKLEVEENLGMSFQFFEEVYSNTFKLYRGYLSSVYDKWLSVLEPAAVAVYNYQRINGVNFLPSEVAPQTSNNVRDILAQFKNNSSKAIQATEKEENISPEIIKKAFGSDEGSIENIPDTATQQHSYAVQQWSSLFLIFNSYSHVMGTSYPEISMLDSIRNNQITLVLIPALEQSGEGTVLLGRMFLTAIKDTASKFLGGEKMNLTITQTNIFKDRITPKPIYSIIADEYGSYAIPGGAMATMAQQIRSMNMSLLISIQDKVSLKAGGTDESGQLKALGNSSKIALQLSDDETVEYLKRVILEEEKVDEEYARTATGDIARNGSIKIEKELMFDPKKCQQFQKGMGLLVSDGEPIVFQSFYRAEYRSNTYITRRKKIV